MRVIFLALLVAAVVARAPGAGAETLVVNVSGFEGKKGTLHVMLWKEPAGFPTRFDKAVAERSAPVTAEPIEVTFTMLSKGTYAAAAYQDLNNNGRLDRSILGWPVEPTAASNGATGTMGPPKFSDAAFELRHATMTIDLKLK